MKISINKIFALLALVGMMTACKEEGVQAPVECGEVVTLANDNISVSVGTDGCLASLKNVKTGHDYAAGELLWRLYYDSKQEKEIQKMLENQLNENSNIRYYTVITFDSDMG